MPHDLPTLLALTLIPLSLRVPALVPLSLRVPTLVALSLRVPTLVALSLLVPTLVALPLVVVLARPAAASTADATPADAWQWPLQPQPTVVRAFAPGPTPYSPGHYGVDLAAVERQPVLAAGAGHVSYAGLLAGRGVVVVVHGALRTTYEPVEATVAVGDQVARGQSLGTVATGHSCPAACLHWGLRRGDAYLDPLRLVQGRVRLLPASSGQAPAVVTDLRRSGVLHLLRSDVSLLRRSGVSRVAAPAADARAPAVMADAGPGEQRRLVPVAPSSGRQPRGDGPPGAGAAGRGAGRPGDRTSATDRRPSGGSTSRLVPAGRTATDPPHDDSAAAALRTPASAQVAAAAALTVLLAAGWVGKRRRADVRPRGPGS